MSASLLGLLVDIPESAPYYGFYEFGWFFEVPLAVGSGVAVAIALYTTFPLGLHKLFVRAPNPGIGVARATLLFAAAWFWFVLQTGAASDIVGFYTILYSLFALALLLWAGYRAPVVGVYYPADVLERGNLAAALVIGGFALGTAFAFGGALTGDGPGWWVVAVFFALAYIELRGNMALVARIGNLDEETVHERDVSAGALLGAVALSSGLVAGRAAAGDFHGWETDLPDYARRLWPLLVIAMGGALAGAYSRYSSHKSRIRLVTAGALTLASFVWYFVS